MPEKIIINVDYNATMQFYLLLWLGAHFLHSLGKWERKCFELVSFDESKFLVLVVCNALRQK